MDQSYALVIIGIPKNGQKTFLVTQGAGQISRRPKEHAGQLVSGVTLRLRDQYSLYCERMNLIGVLDLVLIVIFRILYLLTSTTDHIINFDAFVIEGRDFEIPGDGHETG